MALHFMRANQESVIKGQRIRAAHAHGRQEARDNGRLFTSVLPMWLQAPTGRARSSHTADITVIEDRAAVVRGIFTASLLVKVNTRSTAVSTRVALKPGAQAADGAALTFRKSCVAPLSSAPIPPAELR
jgi:hypothetical protein